MMTINHILKTTGYSPLSAASLQAGGYCAGFIPCLTTASGFLGRMYLPMSHKEPPPA